MNVSPIIAPVKDKTDLLPADPAATADITAIKQKATSPAWNQDTDSLEAIRAAIDSISPGAGFLSNDILTAPLNANPTSVITATAAWTWGNWAQVIAPNVVTADFIILGYLVWGTNETQNIQIQLGVGASGSESPIITVPFCTTYASGGEGFIGASSFYPRAVAANARIAARGTSQSTSSRTLYLYVIYAEK